MTTSPARYTTGHPDGLAGMPSIVMPLYDDELAGYLGIEIAEVDKHVLTVPTS